MEKTILVLYKDYHAADSVTEALLDAGLSHQNIVTMSGNYWHEVMAHPEELKDYPVATLEGNEILLKIDADSKVAKMAREIVCNSGPLDVRERVMGGEVHSDRVTMTQPPVHST